MEPVLQFDPASMSVWYTGFLTEQKVDILGGVAEPALMGELGLAVQLAKAVPDGPLRLRAAHVVSAVAHEQRHFVDVLLTNYGQSLMRQFATLALNVPHVISLGRESGALGLPITVYGDRVKRLDVGVEPVGDLERVARDVRNRERMVAEDMVAYATPSGGEISPGGRAQLEAVGYFTQAILLQREFGDDVANALPTDMPDPERFRDQYEWAAILGAALGLVADAAAREGAVPVLAPAICALFYGTLMVRRWGQEQTRVEGGHSGSASARLDPLVGELKRTGMLNAAESTAEAWRAVDDACERVFGRSATAELERDLECEADFQTTVESERGPDDPMARYLSGLHAARRQLAELFMRAPELVINPHHYAQLLTRVLPVPVCAVLSGIDADDRPGWQPLWTGSCELGAFGRQSWAWAAAPLRNVRASNRVHIVQDPDAWTAVIQHLLPIAKLLIRGRQQPVVLGPELQHAEALLAEQGISLRFDPAFAWPLVDTSSDGFWFLSRRSCALCDSCGALVTKGSGRYVPSRFFRHTDALANWLVEHSGSQELGLFNARRSWTGWLLCDACAHELMSLAADSGGPPP